MSDIDTPLELLAEELGIVTGRIEREADLRVTAAVADLNRRVAEAELKLATLAMNIKDGAPGASGEKGLDGSPGPPGVPGEPGPAGLPGMLPIVKAWTDQIHYEGSVATQDGATWQAQRDTGKPPPHDDWVCLARPGRDGTDGASFRICGTWDASKQYAALDTVVLNGGSFAARKDNPGPCPGPDWQLIASQGKQGKPGERGTAGPKGDVGPAGAAVVGMSVDHEGVLRLVNSDGLVVTCDFYPLFNRMSR